ARLTRPALPCPPTRSRPHRRTVIVATTVRDFGGQRAARVLELPAEPARGRFLRLPDGSELQVAGHAADSATARLGSEVHARLEGGRGCARTPPARTSRRDAGGAERRLEGHELIHAQPAPGPDLSPQAARALLAAFDVASRRCPALRCSRPLKSRQQACSARCRAALSRDRRPAA